MKDYLFLKQTHVSQIYDNKAVTNIFCFLPAFAMTVKFINGLYENIFLHNGFGYLPEF